MHCKLKKREREKALREKRINEKRERMRDY